MSEHDIPPQQRAKHFAEERLMEDLREARAKIERLEKALEYTATQRAHEYAVATGCTPAQAFDYVDQLEEEAKRRRLGLGKQAEME